MNSRTDIVSKASHKLTEYLESKSMRKTPERYEILKVICQTQGIFSVDMLGEEMEKKADFRVSRATIFNTLELLTDAQLVVKHTLVRTAMYECNVTPHPMVCLVCQRCEGVTRLEDEEISKWMAALHVKQFHIKQPVLYLHGLCKKCTAAINRKAKNKKKTDNNIHKT